MSNKTYDILKWAATVGLPAITTLYLTLSIIWGWPYAEQIGASLTAVTTCACALLGLSSANYRKKNGG
jgi:hypothetical protein